MTTAIYARISRDSDGKAEGVKTQERNARRYAAETWPDEPVRVFVDNDMSAAAPDTHRLGYAALVDAIRRGDIAHVVVAEQSRLTRRPAEWEELVVVLDRAGIDRVHTYRNGPVAVKGSKLLGRILAAVDAEEVERLRTRIGDRLDALAAEGRPAGGRSFGYRHATDAEGRKTLEVDQVQADAARWAADAVLSGWSLASVAAHFDADHIPTSRGGAWTSTTVRSMLLSPTLTGLRVHRGEIVGNGMWTPILDRDTWRRVGALLRSPHAVVSVNGETYHVSRRRSTPRRYLLTGGIAVCGRCGAPLIAQRRAAGTPGSRPAYLCHASRGGCNGIGIGAEPLEDHVVAVLLAELARPDFATAIDQADTDDRAALVAELEAVEARRAELAEMWASGALTAGEWSTARVGLEARHAAAEVSLAASPSPMPIDPDQVRDGWGAMTLEERRHIVATFIESVTIGRAKPGTRRFDPARVTIAWR